jgi:ankyrin repeat protein
VPTPIENKQRNASQLVEAPKVNLPNIPSNISQSNGNKKEVGRYAPLPCAIWYDSQIAEALIYTDVDVNAQDIFGNTPAHWAASKGDLEAVQLLVERGAELDIPNIDGQTPLHKAADAGNLDVVDFLIGHHANVNAPTRDNSTPLHKAVRSGHKEVVEYLLDVGADRNIKDNAGRTPLDIAKEFIRSESYNDFRTLWENAAYLRMRSEADREKENQRSEIIQLLSQ